MRAVCGAACIKCQAHSPPCSRWGAWTGAPPQPPHLARCGAHPAYKNGLPRHLSVFRGRSTRISPQRRVAIDQSPREAEGRFVPPWGQPEGSPQTEYPCTSSPGSNLNRLKPATPPYKLQQTISTSSSSPGVPVTVPVGRLGAADF